MQKDDKVEMMSSVMEQETDELDNTAWRNNWLWRAIADNILDSLGVNETALYF